MTSITRQLRRKNWGIAEFREKFPSPPQPVELKPDGGYVTFHPTKGRRVVSARRVRLYS